MKVMLTNRHHHSIISGFFISIFRSSRGMVDMTVTIIYISSPSTLIAASVTLHDYL